MTAAAGLDARLVHTDHEAAVLVRGEIDVATCGRRWPVMEYALSPSARLVLDLAETTYIDSCGLTRIVRAHRRLGQRRGAVVIGSPGPAARKLLSVTGVDRLVTIEDPRDGPGGGPGTNRARPTAPPRPDDLLPDPTRERIVSQQGNGSGETLVTFRLPAEVGATTVSLVGEFNDWSSDAHRMRREDDAFIAVIPLMPGRVYRFRYLVDGERWLNDWAADAYVPNEFGGDDSVVDLTDLPPVELPTDGATVEALPSTGS